MTSRLLLDPAPANDTSGGGGAPPPAAAPAIPVSEPAQTTGLSVPATAVFGEDHKGFFTRLLEKTKAALPKQTTIPAPKEPDPEPAPAAAATPEPPKAATPPPAPAAPAATPEPPKKVKIGDKEWDVAELEKILKGSQGTAPAPAAAATPPPAAAPQPPQAPTPEQVAAQKRQEEAARKVFIDGEREKLGSYIAPIAKERLDKILTGEEGAAAELQSVLAETAAAATLRARESIYDELNPVFEAFDKRIAPIIQHQEQLQRYQAEQEFLKANADYNDHIDDARRVADALIRTYPNEVSQMSREQFFAHVKEHTDHFLNEQAKQMSRGKIADWRQWDTILKNAVPTAPAPAAAAPATPPPSGTPATATPAAATPPAVPAQPPKPKQPSVKPPAANIPGVYLNGEPPKQDWHQSVAASLRS